MTPWITCPFGLNHPPPAYSAGPPPSSNEASARTALPIPGAEPKLGTQLGEQGPPCFAADARQARDKSARCFMGFVSTEDQDGAHVPSVGANGAERHEGGR